MMTTFSNYDFFLIYDFVLQLVLWFLSGIITFSAIITFFLSTITTTFSYLNFSWYL